MSDEMIMKTILHGWTKNWSADKTVECARRLGFKIEEDFVLRQTNRIDRHFKPVGGIKHDEQTESSNSVSIPVRLNHTVSRYTEL